MSQTRKPKLNEHIISCVVIQHSLHIISFPMPAMHAVGVLVSSEEMRLSFAACRKLVKFHSFTQNITIGSFSEERADRGALWTRVSRQDSATGQKKRLDRSR